LLRGNRYPLPELGWLLVGGNRLNVQGQRVATCLATLSRAAVCAQDWTMTDDGVRATRRLLATRFVRSIGQGALAVDFAL